MKMDQNGHHLRWRELACTVSLRIHLQSVGFPLWLKAKPKVIDITEQFE
jgi:hypothetical protein